MNKRKKRNQVCQENIPVDAIKEAAASLEKRDGKTEKVRRIEKFLGVVESTE